MSDEIDLSSILSTIILIVCFAGWALFMVVNPLINWGVTVQFSPLPDTAVKPLPSGRGYKAIRDSRGKAEG